MSALTRLVWIVVALLLTAIAIDAALLWRDQGRNALIEAGTLPDESEVPELRFAHAYALARAQPPASDVSASVNTNASAGGVDNTDDAALKAYRGLQTDPTLGAAARFNSANLLLRRALELHAGKQPTQALPLVELAKEQYRDLLRRDPQQWPARYNLERAQRLLPDPPETEAPEAAAPREREHSASRSRAQSIGLP